MNLMTGLLRPTQGHISVLGVRPDQPEMLFRFVGYCTQFDSFPRGMTGYQFIYSYLRLYGKKHVEADQLAWHALERVKLTDAADRKIAGYSKGMRQRIKLAQAISSNPMVLVLDEPLNGLDPLVRSETIAMFRSLAEEGLHVIVSSHILHEVDAISDQVILLSSGYVVAEGQIHGVRKEVEDHPMQILIRCAAPGVLASRIFELDSVVEARVHVDGKGLLVRTRDPERFYLTLNRLVAGGVDLESVAPADDDAQSVYEYLIGPDGGAI
jgi:ABC-2 type transport system ATP-binding protein